ncbi:MAG: hypothetical protein HY541_08160 [Deltaproteobacteria bacterium]|nr:hypothetical protein [Deltaproteobacteria bacterium]
MDMGITSILNNFRTRLQPGLWCGLFLLALLGGCGDSDSAGINDNTDAVDNADNTDAGGDGGITCGEGAAAVKAVENSYVTGLPEGTSVSPTDTGCSNPYAFEYQISSTDSGDLIFSFYLDGLVDMSNVVADRDDEASFVYFPNESDKSSLAADRTFYLYVPCTEDVSSLLVCPGVASLEEVVEDCPDSVTLTPATEVGNYWWDSLIGVEKDCAIEVGPENLGAGFGAKAL